ncbi:hypothetical protein Vretimale_19077 [Volvox reticuliferus]|uniref:PDZ domain-containing protein n=1 Tax=Volvox reticuliferus TaxID=1737510 RepID=A0A8J4GZR0_9CHLO|nr:hypothetical protein Vretifemale_20525 [Volvox reticuliferus]GIM16445.1 hypothetical protein Vretimale_19077 [Volvox reticuliferus]
MQLSRFTGGAASSLPVLPGHRYALATCARAGWRQQRHLGGPFRVAAEATDSPHQVRLTLRKPVGLVLEQKPEGGPGTSNPGSRSRIQDPGSRIGGRGLSSVCRAAESGPSQGPETPAAVRHSVVSCGACPPAVYVAEVVEGGAAARTGRVLPGDILSKCSAVVLKAGKEGLYEAEGYGQRPYDNWEVIEYDCEGKDFKTVMTALRSNNERWGKMDVTLVLRRP